MLSHTGHDCSLAARKPNVELKGLGNRFSTFVQCWVPRWHLFKQLHQAHIYDGIAGTFDEFNVFDLTHCVDGKMDSREEESFHQWS